MKIKASLRLSVTFLYLQIYLCLASGETKILKVGEKVTMHCESSGSIRWSKNGQRLRGADAFANPLAINNVQLINSADYTCQKDNTDLKTVKLLVIEVVANPSCNLLESEDLTLEIKSSPEVSIYSQWTSKHEHVQASVLRVKKVQSKHSGVYRCNVKAQDGTERVFDTTITVSGLEQTPSVQYISRKDSVTIPWIFNFKVRKSPLETEPKVIWGRITYPSKKFRNLTISMGMPCWNEQCQFSDNDDHSLSFFLLKPEIGLYQLEILMNLEGRSKTFQKEVCVANLTVLTSKSVIHMEANVTLHCDINCLDEKAQICWYHAFQPKGICGPPGQRIFSNKLTAIPETLGNWTCSVLIAQKRVVNSTISLVVTPGFFRVHNPMLWVVVSVGVFVLLVIGIFLAIVTARCRRVRRARYRRWLLENLHQHRVCECHGFAPKRFKDNA